MKTHSSMISTVAQSSSEHAPIAAAWAQFQELRQADSRIAAFVRPSLIVPGYRLLNEIHRGGQGVVYQAIQESTRKKVAIKVLKEGPLAGTREFARFDLEVDILSRINHPHIVAIHERGLASGHAYYTMDYIAGQPLDAFVASAGLNVDEILQLFAKICNAVNVAHLRGVIHRDLKPANIRIDEEGEPKVLDFGLAKLVGDSAGKSSAAGVTITGQFVGSLPWTSPEQSGGESGELDIRTDVYSLGVILYQLLTGRFPYPVSGRIDEVIRHIGHTTPARVSSPHRRIDHDLELIVLKCLAKEPERRYQSAGDLARDILCYLADEPVSATSPSAAYRLRKFVRRNRGTVVSAATIVAMLLISTIVSIAFGIGEARQRTEAVRASEETMREKTRADQEAAAAKLQAELAIAAQNEAEKRQRETEQVADFQSQMLRDIDVEAMGQGIKAAFREQVRSAIERQYVGEYPDRRKHTQQEVEAELAAYDERAGWAQPADVARNVIDEYVLKRAEDAVEEEFADQPLLQAEIMGAIGTNYHALGLYEKAKPCLRAAMELRRKVLGPAHEDIAESLTNLAWLLKDRADYSAAEPLFRDALAMRRQLQGEEHPSVANSLNELGRMLWDKGDRVAAEPLLREALSMHRRLLGDENLSVALDLNNLALLLTGKGDYTAAEPLYREALAMYRRLLGDEHSYVAANLSNLAKLLGDKGDFVAAESLFREALALRRKLHGDEHPNVATALNNLGWLLNAKGDYAGAEPPLRDALALNRRLRGNEHPEVATSLNNLASLMQDMGDQTEAEPLFRESLVIYRRAMGEENSYVAMSLNNLASLLQDKGDYSAAEPLFREAIEMRRKLLGNEHWNTLSSVSNLGSLLLALGRPKETVALLAPLEAVQRRTFTGGNTLRLGRFLTHLGRARAQTGEYDAAEAHLTEAHSIVSKDNGARRQDRVNVLTGLSELYASWAAAEPDMGHEAKAAEWREKLDTFRIATRSADELGREH